MDYQKPFTLIIADDDEDDRELLSNIFLQNERFKLVNCLKSGIEVFDEISRKKNIPDVLLIDMYMPYFTGVEIVRALETMNAAPSMVKFVISSDINMIEKGEQLDNPYIIFIKKPVSRQEMNDLPSILMDSLSTIMA